MKNFEKYEKEIMEVLNDGDCISVSKKWKIVPCCFNNCQQCIFYGECNEIALTKWLYEEYVEKPVLNKYERAFCEAMGAGWIVCEDGYHCVCSHKPEKHHLIDNEYEWWDFGHHVTEAVYTYTVPSYINPELKFNFIKFEDKEPWSIEELLKLEYEK